MGNPESVRISFPGDLAYIPAIRKFASDIIQVCGHGDKFAYRSEIIVDEICNNAVSHGCRTSNACVELESLLYDDRVEFVIKDEGGSTDNISKLKASVSPEDAAAALARGTNESPGLGLEIVRMLSQDVTLEIDDKNLTSIRVVRKREEFRNSGETPDAGTTAS